MPRLSWTFVLLLAATDLSAAEAFAGENVRPVRDAISVEPGATCLDRTTLVEEVEAWLGTPAGGEATTDVTVEVQGSRDDPRVVAFSTVRDGLVLASRTFAPGPARCEHLHAMLGLTIAMALRATLVEELAHGGAAAAVAAPSPAPEEQVRRWGFGGDGVASFGILPDAAFGGDIRVERALGPVLRVRAGVLAVAAWGETFAGARGRFDSWLLAPRADLCAEFQLASRLSAAGCVGTTGGWMRAAGQGFAVSEAATEAWVAVANGLDFKARMAKNWSIDLATTLILPLARNSIVLRDESGAVRASRDLSPVGVSLGVGPVFLF